MDGETRTLLKRVIDARRREAVDRSGIRLCPYCFNEFEPKISTQKFCSSRHRRSSWDRSENGNANRRRNKTAYHARRRLKRLEAAA